MAIVTTDAYHWYVTYQDGSELHEFDEVNTIGRGFAEVSERDSTIRSLSLQGIASEHRVDIPDGALPVFFRRRQVTLDPNTETQQHGTLAHCIGWKREESAVYLFVFEDGSTLLTDDLQAV